MLYGKEHVQKYEETGGDEGYHWRNGTTILLLHTKGRTSGKDYTHPLIYREHGDDYLIVASKGGDPESPEWFKNLEADPDTTVQIKADTVPVRARVATAQERPALWAHMTEVWPDYDEYAKKTDREIPVVVLEPA